DPAEVAVGNEPIGQLAADHPGRAGHCDMHSDPPLVFRRSLRTRGLPSGKNAGPGSNSPRFSKSSARPALYWP
ncbi:MAG: hypothetical protein WCD63_09270, partial [Terrimicrobiaceae bacterium]